MLSRAASISHRIWDWKEFKVIFDEQVRTSSREGEVCRDEIWNKTSKKKTLKIIVNIMNIIREIIFSSLTILKNNYIISIWIDIWILRLVLDWLSVSRNFIDNWKEKEVSSNSNSNIFRIYSNDHRFYHFQILKTRFRQTIENNKNTFTKKNTKRTFYNKFLRNDTYNSLFILK